MLIATYFLPDFFLSMTWPLDNFPELNELIERYLAVPVEVDRIEKLIRWYFPEAHLRPVPLGLLAIDCFITVLVKYLEDTSH
jgi:hypothetical protein